MAGELAAFGTRIASIADEATARRMADKAGEAAKRSTLQAAASATGGDRRMSNLNGGTTLNADVRTTGSQATIVPRPGGAWKLLDKGRRSSGQINPKRRRAVLTPGGPRAWSTYSRSRGTGVWDKAVDESQRTAPKAAADEFRRVVASKVR